MPKNKYVGNKHVVDFVVRKEKTDVYVAEFCGSVHVKRVTSASIHHVGIEMFPRREILRILRCIKYKKDTKM